MKPKILGCFFQAGGLNALAPLLKKLNAEYDLSFSGRAPAFTGTSAICDTFFPLEKIVSPSFNYSAYDLILTDTINLTRAVDAQRCRTVWEKARGAGTPSLAFIDSWWGYDERFILPGESSHSVLPDMIAVVDDIAQNEMIQRSYPPERIAVLGSPLFESLRNMGLSVAQRRTSRSTAKSLVFVSQPLEKVFRNDASWGFTEKTILKDLVHTLNQMHEKGIQTSLLVLPHPEENAKDLNEFLTGIKGAVDVRVAEKHNAHPRLLQADLVLGMFSILLVESLIMGKPVLSIQLDLKREDMLVSNMVKATRAIRSREDLATTLRQALIDPAFCTQLMEEHKRFQVINDSIERWTRAIRQLTNGKK